MANWPALGSIILPNVGSAVNYYYFAGEINKGKTPSWYDQLKKPKWAPPKCAFAPVCTILYSGMGYASYLIYKECDGFTAEAVLPLSLYGSQLALNWAYSPIFFGLKDFKLSFIECSIVLGAAIATTISFYSVSHPAGRLLLPYIAWLSMETAMTYYIWKNNPKPAKGVEITELLDKSN